MIGDSCVYFCSSSNSFINVKKISQHFFSDLIFRLHHEFYTDIVSFTTDQGPIKIKMEAQLL